MKNQWRAITHTFNQPMRNLAAGVLALALGLFAGASNSHATAYTWTNVTIGASDYWQNPFAWSPSTGVPNGIADTATFNFAGTLSVYVTNKVLNLGNFNVGPSASGGVLNITFELGTNAFTGTSGDSSSSSSFVIGQGATGIAGTAIVWVAGTPLPGGMLCTNAGGLPRLTLGRNAPGWLNVTNGTVICGNLIIANAAGADGSKLVLSGPNTYWTNSGILSECNSAGVGRHSIVISNSASMTVIASFDVPKAASSFNSVLVDSNGRMFYRCASGTKNLTIGNQSGASNNTVTVQGGALWDNGLGNIVIAGAGGGGINNALIVGNSGLVSNITTLNNGAGGSVIVSGGVLAVSGSISNSSGAIQGSGIIKGNTFFTGTGTLTPGFGTTVGKLTFSNNVTLVSGATTVVKLDKGQTGSNDLVNVAGTLAEAGTLTVNNVGAALVGGETFKILALGSKSGDFTTTNLPSLSGTLIWNTSQLGAQGIISVILPPAITGPNPQAVLTNTDVTISTTVVGVPAPGLKWQRGGVDLTDGATGNGSTISGSTSDTLTILNAQVADSGQYCLIATNIGGSVTNCMTLEVTVDTAAPLIGGPAPQNVISPNDATFTAVVVGIPTPTQQWQDNGVNIPNATNTSVTIPAVTFALDGHSYCIIASNSAGMATNCALLHVVVPPAIQTQPVSLVVTQTQSATFSVVSTNGVPAVTYQWYFNNAVIPSATSASYTILSAVPANAGTYKVVVANTAGSATSSDATLTVNSTMAASVTPPNAAIGVCYDTPLYMAFDRPVVLKTTGKIKIFNVNNSVTPVDTVDVSQNDANGAQPRAIANDSNGPFNTFPVIITGNTAAIYPHLGVMTSNQVYYVTVDPGTFAETNGALYAGVTDTNAWRFTTKSAPINPNNLVVAANGIGDFCTVQGALDSLPSGNTTPTLVNIRNGTYTELVNTRFKNNVTFRGQNRYQTIIKYANNSGLNGGTHTRIVFKVFSNDIAIDNLTVTNSTVSHSAQAECFMLEANIKHFILNNAEAHSFLDTIDSNTDGTQGYINNCLIRGDQDVIWGNANLFINNSEIRTLAANGSSTQARTDTPGDTGIKSNGMSFVNCQITVDNASVTQCLLGRSLGNADANVVYSYCFFNTNLIGWTDGPASRYWEYSNSNLTGTAAAPVWAPANKPTEYLTNGDARLTCALNPSCWLNGWTPLLSPNIVGQPTNFTVTAGQVAQFTVNATGIPDPTYQWLKNGNIMPGKNDSTLTFPFALGDDNGIYSVIVSNDAGVVISDNAALTVNGTGATASFTANPTSGDEPLAVTFTDTSTGSPNITLFWNLGDGTTPSTAGGASFTHAYPAGTYTVTLTASNWFGASTVTQSNLVVAVNAAFESWQMGNFGCTNCPQAVPSADPDGDGMNNMAEYLAGTDPNNSASGLRVISMVRQGANTVITWTTAGGRTNVVQVTAGDVNGNYTNNFTNLSSPIVISGSGDATTNYTDVGGATNRPSRYYRVRLAP